MDNEQGPAGPTAFWKVSDEIDKEKVDKWTSGLDSDEEFVDEPHGDSDPEAATDIDNATPSVSGFAGLASLATLGGGGVAGLGNGGIEIQVGGGAGGFVVTGASLEEMLPQMQDFIQQLMQHQHNGGGDNGSGSDTGGGGNVWADSGGSGD
jgi:hypothetical protein